MAYNPWDPQSSANDEDNAPPPRYARPYGPPPPSAGAGTTFLQSFLIAGCVTIMVPILMVGGFFALLIYMASSSLDTAGESPLGSIYQSGSGGPNMRERVVRPGSEDAAIAIITIHGPIDGGGSPLEGDGTLANVSQQIRAAAENDSVMAVILQIDSPGGGLTASDLLHHEVVRLRETGKPVLAWAGSMMASGGYYIAVAAEEIMASPTSTVGSIGVIMHHFQVRELLEKIGVKADPITSGERKDLASPFREMTPAERRLLQDYIDTAHRRFVEIVAEGRNLDVGRVRTLADGSIFTAARAREEGLIDSIGYAEDALAWAEAKTGRSNMRVISYKRILSFGDLFREAGQGAAGVVMDAAASQPAPQAMAVWDGGGE